MAISAASRSEENCNGSENCMSDQKKYWVNPNGRACGFLKKYELKISETQDNPKRRGQEVIEIKSDNPTPSAEQCSIIGLERPSTKKPSERGQQRRAANATQEKPASKAVTVIDNPEVIEIKTRDALVPYADANRLPDLRDAPKVPKAVFSPPLDLAKFEKTIRQMATTLDFDLPEGLLDRWFLRSRNYRIEEKTERVRLIGQFETAVVNMVSRQCGIAEEVRRHNQIRYQQLLDALKAWNTAVEEHYRGFLAAERAKDDRAIEIERTKVEIEKHRAEVRGIQRGQNVADAEAKARIAKAEYLAKHPEPPPPPPLPPPPAPPVPEEDQIRQKAKRTAKLKCNIALDELDALADLETEKADRALERILQTWGNAHIDRNTMRRRIEEVIQQFGVDESTLPRGVQELIFEEELIDE